MSERRRMLMAIANQFKWLPYSFEYLYHSLVPQTISGKSVKNKAKVSTIYGNSVVENQQALELNANNYQIGDWYGINHTVSFGDNIATLTVVSNNSGIDIMSKSNTYFVNNHSYLVKANIKATLGGTGRTMRCFLTANVSTDTSFQLSNGYNLFTAIKTYNQTTTQTGKLGFVFFNNAIGDIFEISNWECFDLTQMFPFDTPTTLTDNRVQAILNRGYIPYNNGELKSVDIGEFSSEPYNLLSLDRTQGNTTGWNSADTSQRLFDETKYYVGLTQNNYFNEGRITSFTFANGSITLEASGGYGISLPKKIIGGKTYTLEYSNSGSGTNYVRIGWYDKDGNYLSSTSDISSGGNATAPTNAYWCSVVLRPAGEQTYSNICIHRTGTRTGYAPHTQPQTISFKYQGGGVGTSKNSWEITNTNHIFTRSNFEVKLSSLTFSKYGTAPNYLFYADVSGGRSGLGAGVPSNILCDKYNVNTLTQGGTATSQGDDKTATWDANHSQILIKDTTYATASDFQNNVSGTLEYQLATPQTITIPRKHLGCIDLGTLAWEYQSAKQRFFTSSISNIKNASTQYLVGNVYVGKYLSKSFYETDQNYSTIDNICCTYYGNNHYFYVVDKRFTNATDFKNAMQGQYLFYETQNEVADILDTIGIEAGGTINANWFSWVENQLVDTNKKSYTNTQTDSGTSNIIRLRMSGSPYTTFSTLTLTTAGQVYSTIYTSIYTGNTDIVYSGVNVNFDFASNISLVSGHKYLFTIKAVSLDKTTIGGFQTDNLMLIDLTLAGIDTTDINDYRIQAILKKGYLPQNTTGTLTHEQNEVLPNVKMRVKCK